MLPQRTSSKSLAWTVAALSAVLALMSSTSPASSTGAQPSVKVATSRGECTLRLYPAKPSGPEKPAPGPLILLISGEGGWRSFDVLLAGFLSAAGYWVGGVDAKQYFWNPQDDRHALAEDMRQYAAALARAAGRREDAPLILAGFSFGADISPWVAGAGGWGGRLRGLLMLGPDETGSLEFRLSEILGFEAKDHVFSVAEALRSAAGVPALFIHGEKDSKSAAPLLLGKAAEPKRLIVVPGADHHFSGREEDLRAALSEGLAWFLETLPTPSSPRSRP